ncbi:tetraacyldisaccharide 4'-kinase [Stappia sp. WLB 29]|uniref:tetraacyldisaccharide 4'-kinase n=1 Tax=Stappia sp. WLB 29 TaxID=2925220 RepID=UPI0020BED4ED
MSGALSAPSFWWRPPGPAAFALAPIGWLYGAITASRMARKPAYTAAVPVICVGNFTVGGTGKTPFALALAEGLRARGEKPVFLTRGYGGRLSGGPPVLLDPARHGPVEAGDEPLLLAADGPVVIAADRAAGARLAERLGSVILMDDGLQNPALAKTVSLALVDAASGIGNGFCLPAGPLRAPVERQLAHIDALVTIGDGTAASPVEAAARARGLPIFRASLDAREAHWLTGIRVLAFAGIGRPERFAQSLRAAGAEVVQTRFFGDHRAFTEREAQELLDRAAQEDLVLVTTAKDRVRLGNDRGDNALARLARQAKVLGVEMRPDDPQGLAAFLGARLSQGVSPHS